MRFKFPLIGSSAQNQYLATIVVMHGCALGWSSPMLPYLRSENTHLNAGPISVTQASWIGSAMTIGSMVNILVIGWIAEFLGKKKCLILLCFPNLIFWVLTYLSTNVYHIYAARFIAGLTGGGLLRMVPVFTAEVADRSIRGKLGIYFPLAFNFGLFLIYVFGAYLDYFIISYIMIPILVFYFIFMLFLHETPQYLLKHGKDEKALKSLKFYRNCHEKDLQNVQTELEDLKTNVLNVHKEKVKFEDFVEKSVRRGLIMSFLLIIINGLSGNIIILTYTADIFLASGSSLSANESAIIIGAIQFSGIYLSSFFIDRYGRKILFGISCVGSGLALLTLATYSYVDINFEISSNLAWIPIVSLSAAILFHSFGISTLPFVIITELVPQKIREATMMSCMTLTTLMSTINLRIYPPLAEVIYLYGCMYIYAGCCLFGTLVTIFVMPETKGKNLFQAPQTKKEES